MRINNSVRKKKKKLGRGLIVSSMGGGEGGKGGSGRAGPSRSGTTRVDTRSTHIIPAESSARCFCVAVVAAA